jgi:5,10-methenyltetrahydromethanopterin hydrogenase
VIKKGHSDYKDALIRIISAHKEFAQNMSDSYQKEIQDLENKLSAL